jgi:hypothetical protein
MPALNRIKPGGVALYCDPLGELEAHASTCSHCQHITEFPSMRRMMEYVEICRGCMKLICLGCVGKPCVPYEKECERQEAEYRLQRRIEGGGWGCY